MIKRFFSSLVQKESPTLLVPFLTKYIKAKGPISISEYMRLCSTYPEYGYYMKKDVFGRKGDFITSPEVSQLFGEMIALWSASHIKSLDHYAVNYIEFGPGRGTLAFDILKTWNQVLLENNIRNIIFIEPSNYMRNLQFDKLQQLDFFISKEHKNEKLIKAIGNKLRITWYDDFLELPSTLDGYSFILAHEVFDALPVRKYQKGPKGLNEILVEIDDKETSPYHFQFMKSPVNLQNLPFEIDLKENDFIENSMESNELIRNIGKFVNQNLSTCLIIDYGHNYPSQDSFRGIQNHKFTHPLSKPGDSDLTFDVDFSQLASQIKHFNNVNSYHLITQRQFLLETGIEYRLMQLMTKASKAQMKSLISSYDRLIKTKEMGNIYKFFMFHYKNSHLKPFPFTN